MVLRNKNGNTRSSYSDGSFYDCDSGNNAKLLKTTLDISSAKRLNILSFKNSTGSTYVEFFFQQAFIIIN